MEIGEKVREYALKYKRARSEKSLRKYKSMIDNQVGYQILRTGKDAEQVKREWGLRDDYK